MIIPGLSEIIRGSPVWTVRFAKDPLGTTRVYMTLSALTAGVPDCAVRDSIFSTDLNLSRNTKSAVKFIRRGQKVLTAGSSHWYR